MIFAVSTRIQVGIGRDGGACINVKGNWKISMEAQNFTAQAPENTDMVT